eukprot:TRINITY_DN5268_c0_g1_i2.p1 TRINITY_DN5268_c0_g1~~TRINITY_DN5268_c0_g1_i2.p1  ORF type:complete len:113 (-),score=34.53 TRINITY_DN5268_c0_g1_i2:104-442(-)
MCIRDRVSTQSTWEIWQHFSECGKIENVRIVRDRISRLGKGIGYIRFADARGYRAGLTMTKSKLRNRELRIKKAVEPKRLEKKKKKKELKYPAPTGAAQRILLKKRKKGSNQ